MPIVGPFGNECDRSLNIERSLDIGSPVSTVGGLLFLRTGAAAVQPPSGTAYRPICEESSRLSFLFSYCLIANPAPSNANTRL